MKHLCVLLFLFTCSIQAQFQLNGIVKDAATRKPLPFATISINAKNTTVTDVDGKFSFLSNNSFSSFDVSYIGYKQNTIVITKDKRYYVVNLSQKKNELNEIVIKTDNPALSIIKKAIEHKNENNPQKKLSSFEFKTYNRLLVTANPDSIKGSIDTIKIQKTFGEKIVKIDSAKYKFKEIIRKQHLFQTEKVSLYQYSHNKLKETVLGTKMAGFKQPIYEIIAFNLQSFSIYDSNYELFETKYNSPIAKDALRDYNYTLLDTVSVSDRKAFVIYFKNKKERKSSGLEGVLYIDQNNFAVSKAVMRIRGVLDISGIHEFKYIPEEDIYFPVNKTFKIAKGKNDDDIKILGGTIQFDGDIKGDFKGRKKQTSDYTYLLSESNNFDIRYNIPIKIKKSAVAIEIKDDAVNKPDSFWETYRKDSLDSRSQNTYSALDSISIKKRIESRIRFGRKVINGYLPLGFIDLNLRKVFSYNNYEGFRLGVGGVTNEQFSRKYKIEGYSAYGTKDGAFKYNIGFSSRLEKFSNTWIGVSYTDDVREIGSTVFPVVKKPFKIYDPRPINISTFYNYVSWKAFVETKILPKSESIWELNHAVIDPKFNYAFNLNGKLFPKYTMTTAMVSIQWNPFSDYMQTPTGRIEAEKRFPKFTFQFTQSLPKVWDNDFGYTKIDFRTEYEKKYLNGQKTSLMFEAGYALGDIPLTHLYNNSPNNITKETIIKRMTFAGRNSFETMYFNEFFSSEFVFFQFKHGFKKVRIFEKIKPSLVLVSRMAWGNMSKPEQHTGLEFKTLNNGFFESGIELNQIFNGLGLTAFYRYGPNQLPKFEDNIAIKLSFVLNLGL
jgi:hypothetical protein